MSESLLSFESMMNVPENSYNGYIKALVTQIRQYREQPFDDFQNAVPELRALERNIQRMDEQFGNGFRNYIEEIMDELDEQEGCEQELVDEHRRVASSLIPQLFNHDYDAESVFFVMQITNGISWLLFQGSLDDSLPVEEILVHKDILRKICFSRNVVFVDRS